MRHLSWQTTDVLVPMTMQRSDCRAWWLASPVACVILLTLFASLASALAPGDSVVINEVHYAPGEPSQETHEFIELFNAGSSTAYLDGAVITDEGNAGSSESTFQFPGVPGGTQWPLAPGEFLLLVPDATGSPYTNIDFEFFAGGADTDDLGVANLLKTSGLATELILGNSGDGITLSSGISSGNLIPCAEIVDGVSWESGGVGDTTALSDSTCLDASPGGPVSGSFSLQRCSDGFDTDSSSDFVILFRTPGIANNCPAPPSFIDQGYSPCIPMESQTVQASSYWTDSNDNLQEVWVHYRNMTLADFDSLLMAPMSDSLYQVTLPGNLDQTLVEYFFVARDSSGMSTRWPNSGTTSYRVGMVDLVDVQFPVAADSCASSLLVGQAVNVSGVVTHIAREYSDFYFYIQQGTAPNSAVRVFVETGFLPELGDSVVASGVVSEFMCQTQIDAYPGCVYVADSGRPVVARVLPAIEDVELEENESMLVTINGPIDVQSVMMNEVHDGVLYLEFQVGAALDPVWIGADTFAPDSIFYSVLPFPGQVFDSVTGIVALRETFLIADPGTRLRLEPRRDYDIDVNYSNAEPTPTRQSRLLPNHPNPFNPNTTISYALAQPSRLRIDIFNVAGSRVRQLVPWRLQSPGVHRVLWNGSDDRGVSLPSGVYLVKMEAAGRLDSRKVHLLR